MNPGLTIILIALAGAGIVVIAIYSIRARWEKNTQKAKKTEAQYAREEVESLLVKVEPEPSDKDKENDKR